MAAGELGLGFEKWRVGGGGAIAQQSKEVSPRCLMTAGCREEPALPLGEPPGVG